MMKKNAIKLLLSSLFLCFQMQAHAEDIDLFAGVPEANAPKPNVLIVLDNTANWTAPFSNEMEAIASLVDALPADKFKLGIMMFSESGGANSGPDGAYVRATIRQLTASNKVTYRELVKSFNVLSDKGNGGKAGKAMQEAHAYFAGLAPYAGNNKVKTDFKGNVSGSTQSKNIYAIGGNALPSKAGSPYVSPVSAACGKNFIIYISNGPVQDNSADTTDAKNALAALGGNTTTLAISPSGSQANVADEWVRFMKKSSLGITTYTVDIDKTTSGQGPGWTALLKSMATVSSGRYYDASSSGKSIVDSLITIFSEIQSVNSVFSSVSLPVSINTQGTFLNQLYVGMFRPDASAQPKWNGNLKQYKLGIVGDKLKLLDADEAQAINTSTGFITECARSYWTPTSLDSYWSFKPQGGCLIANSDASNFPDGNIVEKGSAAHLLRNTGSRNMKTCNPLICATLTDFNSTTVTQTMVGAATVAEHSALISWERGLDVDDENLNGNTTDRRPSIHGDVVHSRPVAINYGTDLAPQIVVFYGGNDGILRAINGNRTAGFSGTPAGGEFWSFVAPDFYPKIKRMRDNNIKVSFPGSTTGTPTPKPKDYGVDGVITGFSSPTSKLIFASMRRGGRTIYAFDVTNPETPVLKWRVGCPNATDDIGCTSGYSGLGQTWSSLTPLTSSGYVGGTKGMLITGGGYDICQDGDPNTGCNTASRGTGVFLMDMNTGALVRKFTTDSGVSADITVVKDSITGAIKYAYAADMAGNIYRISGSTPSTPVGTTAPADMTITKIASLGGSGADNRKFLFAPDVVEDADLYYLLIGSGDREKPLASFTAAASVQNKFYFIKEDPEDTTWLTSEFATCGANVICSDSLVKITTAATPTKAELAGKKGWSLLLDPTEQVVTSAITVFGTVTFSTNAPNAVVASPGGTCPTLGKAEVYNLNYKNAQSSVGLVRGQTIVGGGLPPSPVAGMITLDNGQTVPFIVGASPDSSLEGGAPISSATVKRAKNRVYWNVKK